MLAKRVFITPLRPEDREEEDPVPDPDPKLPPKPSAHCEVKVDVNCANVSATDLTENERHHPHSSERILPVLGDLKEPLYPLANARWRGVLASESSYRLSEFRLDATDLPTLCEGQWLSSCIIDYFATLLTAQSVKSGIHMFPVYVYTLLMTKGYNYDNVIRMLVRARLDLTYLKHILVPCHVNGNHNVLVDVDIKGRKFVLYDSPQKAQWDRTVVLSNVQRMIQDAIDCRKIAAFFLKHRVCEWEVVDQTSDVPQQSDPSCGVFMCGFASCIATGSVFLFEQSDISSMRIRIGLAILDGAPSRRSALRASQSDDEETANTSSNADTPVVDLTLPSVDNDDLGELDISESKPQQAPPLPTLKTPDATQNLVIIKNERSSEIARWNVYPGVSLQSLPPFQPNNPESDLLKLGSQPFASRKSLVTRILRRPLKTLLLLYKVFHKSTITASR